MGVHQVLILVAICSLLHQPAMSKIIVPPYVQTSHNLFASDLMSAITETRAEQNVVYSPASIQTSLALIYAGAGGETAKEMHKVLHFGDHDKAAVAQDYEKFMRLTFRTREEDEPVLKMANRLYVNEVIKVKEEYKKITQESFYAEAKKIEFKNSLEAIKEINEWVEEQTEHKIQNLMAPGSVDGDTSAVLVNAIYFKADWEKPFSNTSTSQMPFRLNDNERVEVSMMYQDDEFLYLDLPQYNAKALEMNYKNSDLSMLFILPNDVNGLAKLESQLKGVDLNDITSKMVEEDVDLSLPKFKIEFDLDLKEPLAKMGLTSMFSSTADLSHMFETPVPQRVSDAKHKAFLDINEAGSEAAAATYLKIIPMSLNLNQKVFRADHPFFFAIRNRKNVFFAGHVAKL